MISNPETRLFPLPRNWSAGSFQGQSIVIEYRALGLSVYTIRVQINRKRIAVTTRYLDIDDRRASFDFERDSFSIKVGGICAQHYSNTNCKGYRVCKKERDE
jgi:hypothetical protein